METQHGSAYDSAWINSQITGHRTNIANTQAEIDTGVQQDTVHLAQETKPVLQHHLTELEAASGTTAAVSGTTGTVSAWHRRPGGRHRHPGRGLMLILLGASLILAALVGFSRRAQSIRIIR